MANQRMVYTPLLADDVDDDSISEKPSCADDDATVAIAIPTLHRKLWLVHLGIFSLYTIAFLALSAHVLRQKPKGLKEDCLLETSMYSPALKAVEYSVVQFNGSLEHPSPYKGQATYALDEAWNRITTNNSLRPIRISDDELEKINEGGRTSNVRYKEADGGGNMGSIEVFHQLHCLNLLRKYTYPKEYPEVYGLWKTRPKILRLHLDHCVDIIRQSLMCNADVGVISYNWVAGWDVPLPNFNTYHRCRNFDAILDWGKKNRVRIPQSHMTRIGDEVDLPEWHLPD